MRQIALSFAKQQTNKMVCQGLHFHGGKLQKQRVATRHLPLSHLFPYKKPIKEQSLVRDCIPTWPGNPKQGQNSLKQLQNTLK